MSYAAFDPDRFVAVSDAPRVPAVPIVPVAWRHGVDLLTEQRAPRGASEPRWEQVVADANAFARSWGDTAIRLGWSAGNLFGFDPDQPDNLFGLIFDIRGGRVTSLSEDRAAIRRPGLVRYHLRQMPDDAAPLWDFRGKI